MKPALLLLLTLSMSVITSQSAFAQNSADASAPIPMPDNRAADSYAIYSVLMPVGETAGKNWTRKLWLVRDTTQAFIPLNEPCKPTTAKQTPPDSPTNPHVAVTPSEDRRRDYEEILEDWDSHCHDRLLLDRDAWHTSVPVLLLNEQAQSDFQVRRNSDVSGVVDPYEGAPALYGFSMVLFNKAHNVAMVYATQWCGGWCGDGLWVALALEEGQWKRLRWDSVYSIS